MGRISLDESGLQKDYSLTPKHYAYIKISEGCKNACSYCIIPKIKGAFTSRATASRLRPFFAHRICLSRRGTRRAGAPFLELSGTCRAEMAKTDWRGGRVAEGAPLLREYGLTPIEGSNPSLSAKIWRIGR